MVKPAKQGRSVAIKYFPYAITGFLVLAALLAAHTWWIHTQPARVRHQLQASRQVLLDAGNELQSLPSPNVIYPGESSGTTRYQVQRLKGSSERLDKLNIKFPANNLVGSLAHTSTQAVNKSFSNSRNTLTKAQDTISYEAYVMAALEKTLEYNAVLDFQKFTPGSADTTTRLQKSQQGLQACLTRLQTIAMPVDSSLADVTKQIQAMQAARDKLAQDGDTKAWAASVAQAQQAIITNRQTYWQQQISSVTTNLQDANNALAHLQADIN